MCGVDEKDESLVLTEVRAEVRADEPSCLDALTAVSHAGWCSSEGWCFMEEVSCVVRHDGRAFSP